jgi:hypothetical protein
LSPNKIGGVPNFASLSLGKEGPEMVVISSFEREGGEDLGS